MHPYFHIKEYLGLRTQKKKERRRELEIESQKTRPKNHDPTLTAAFACPSGFTSTNTLASGWVTGRVVVLAVSVTTV